MSEEHEPLDMKTCGLKAGRWRIRYYKDGADPDFKDVSDPQWMEKIYHLIKPTAFNDLMVDGFKIGSCWQMR